MARKKNNVSSAPAESIKKTKTQPTAKEMQDWYMAYQQQALKFAEDNDAIKKLRDVTKNIRQRTISQISKESLRTWLQSPSTSEGNLRSLSQYLYYRSQPYMRLVKYNANMFELDAHTIIPNYDFIKENNADKILKSYQDTINIVDNMNLQSNFIRVATACFREDVFYGCKYMDDDGFMFLLPLNADYCRINGVYPTGDLAFSFDCSFFNRYGELLEFWGEPWQSMYDEYQSTNNKWQPMPDEHCACFKFRFEDWETVVPPFSGLFNGLLSLVGTEDIQDLVDEQSIYKLLVATIPTITGANNANEFAVTLQTAMEYFDRMSASLPDYVAAILSPLPIEPISFPDDATTDVNKIQKSLDAVLNTAGGAQVLSSSNISGSTAYKTASKSDSEFAISSLLPQIEGWVNRMLSYVLSNPSKVKFFPVTPYTKEDYRKELLENAQYGLPTKLAINALSGFSAKETMALNYFEEKILGLTGLFVPLQSTHTQSNKDAKKDDGDMTDEGLDTRDEDKNDV